MSPFVRKGHFNKHAVMDHSVTRWIASFSVEDRLIVLPKDIIFSICLACVYCIVLLFFFFCISSPVFTAPQGVNATPSQHPLIIFLAISHSQTEQRSLF
jgi:hypothetical protein